MTRIDADRIRVLRRLSAALLVLFFAAPAFACVGDCDGDHFVSQTEMRAGVEMALGAETTCAGFDRNADEEVTVEELVSAARAIDGCHEQTEAFVITTNFQAGSYATVELDEPRAVSRSTAQRRVHSDAVVRTRGDLVYVVNRRFGDNLQILDPADGFRTRLQCSTGNGSNPHDIAFVSDDKAYITLYEEKEVLIVNPMAAADCHDFILGSIDLGSTADGDGIPDMDQMAIVGDRLYVSLQRLDKLTPLRLPAENGALAVVDIATDSFIGTIELNGENPFAATKGLVVRDGKIYVSHAGLFNVMDGGLEKVDLATGQAEGISVSEADLGGDVSDFVLVSDHLAYAIVSRPGFVTALIAFDPTTRTVTNTLTQADGYTLFDIERNDRGELFLADRKRQLNGVRVYRIADGAPLVERPLDLGLAPFEIVFLAKP